MPDSGSQLTRGLAGSELVGRSVSGGMQLVASNCFIKAASTQLGSLALAGAAVGLGSLSAGVRSASGTAPLGTCVATITGRKFMLAEALMSSRSSSVGLPGMFTTTLVLLSVEIWASETPEPSTRWRMMDTAWSNCSLVMFPAPSTLGARIIWVPPSRSRPSFGDHEAAPARTPPPTAKVHAMMIAASHRRVLRAVDVGPVRAIKGSFYWSRV